MRSPATYYSFKSNDYFNTISGLSVYYVAEQLELDSLPLVSKTEELYYKYRIINRRIIYEQFT